METIDGIRVLKLRDSNPLAVDRTKDSLTMVHIWRLLSGGHPLRDTTLAPRQYR